MGFVNYPRIKDKRHVCVCLCVCVCVCGKFDGNGVQWKTYFVNLTDKKICTGNECSFSYQYKYYFGVEPEENIHVLPDTRGRIHIKISRNIIIIFAEMTKPVESD